MHNTSNFESGIVAVVKEKREKYTVWYRQDGDKHPVTFKLLHICELKLEKSKKDSDCPYYSQKEDECFISNIIYSKLPAPQEPTTKLMPVLDPAPFLPIEPT
jgi:hypothetical protein